MRVVLLSTNMARGGAETQVAQLAMRLRRRGWGVHVVSMLPPSAFHEEFEASGVPLHAPGIPWIPALLRRLRPQVLHCHMFHANLMGRLLRLAMPFPAVISTLHSMAESPRASGRIAARDRLYRITDRLADVTTAVSQAAADRHLEARAVRRIQVIPNGVDTDVFRPDPAARARLRAELELGEGFVWLAVGRLIWKKNYPALLRAFGALARGTVLIAGEGPDEAALRAAAGPGVRFLGLRNDVPALLNAADGFVLSSVVEGLPLVLLEAAATGLTCVATNAGGVRETGVAITVACEEELGAAMRRVMDLSERERRASGEAARLRVEQHYALDRVVSRWEALYRSLGRDSWM